MGEGAVRRFGKALEAERNASGETVRAYLREVRSLRNHVLASTGKDPDGSGGWGNVTAADLRRFLSASLAGCQPSTVARRLSAVRSFFSFLVSVGEVGVNPASGLAAPRRAMRLPEFLPVDEMAGFLSSLPSDDAASKRDAAILELLYSSGLRVGELVALRMGDLSLEGGTVRVTGKGRKVRVVPVGEKAAGALRPSGLTPIARYMLPCPSSLGEFRPRMALSTSLSLIILPSGACTHRLLESPLVALSPPAPPCCQSA